jgi:hypothetical protein
MLSKPQFAWGKQYIKSYKALGASKCIAWVDSDEPAYDYLVVSDAIILTGTSTLEIEATLAHKPLVVVNTEGDPYFDDPLESIKIGVAIGVVNRSIPELEEALMLAMSGNDRLLQTKFLRYHGIRTDSKAYQIIQDALAGL